MSRSFCGDDMGSPLLEIGRPIKTALGIYKPDKAREELMAAQEQAKYEAMSEKQVAKEIKRLEKLMFEHSKNLEFEKAAQVRDQLHLLKEQLFGAPGEDNVVSITGK